MKPFSSFNLHKPKGKNVFMDGTLLPSNLTTQRKEKFEWVLVEIADPSNKTHVPFRTPHPFKVDRNVAKLLQIFFLKLKKKP
jgi:hypothetical protein